MALVEIRDHALWLKHIHGDKQLQEILLQLEGGDIVELQIDGFKGVWKKMEDGKDGRPTPGIKPLGKARAHWHALQDRRHDLVTIQATPETKTQSTQQTKSQVPTQPPGREFHSGNTTTTQIGYVNRNKQKNLGTRDVAGTDHGQVAYKLECLVCGHLYGANGTDVFQRKCPKHQGGKPGIPTY